MTTSWTDDTKNSATYAQSTVSTVVVTDVSKSSAPTYTDGTKNAGSYTDMAKPSGAGDFLLLIDNTYKLLIDSTYSLKIGGSGGSSDTSWTNITIS